MKYRKNLIIILLAATFGVIAAQRAIAQDIGCYTINGVGYTPSGCIEADPCYDISGVMKTCIQKSCPGLGNCGENSGQDCTWFGCAFVFACGPCYY
jgi:hypothetical protein